MPSTMAGTLCQEHHTIKQALPHCFGSTLRHQRCLRQQQQCACNVQQEGPCRGFPGPCRGCAVVLHSIQGIIQHANEAHLWEGDWE